MNTSPVLTSLTAAGLLLAAGPVLADGGATDGPTLGVTSIRSLLVSHTAVPDLPLQSPTLRTPLPPDRPGAATRFVRALSRNLEAETRREHLLTTQAFLLADSVVEDRFLEDFRSNRAEDLLTEALDELVDDRIDRALVEVPGLRKVTRLVERVEKLDLLSLQKKKTEPVSGSGHPGRQARRHRVDGSVSLRVDLNPKLRLKGQWAGFTSHIDLPLTGEPVRVRVQKTLLPGLSAQLESRIPLQGGDTEWTTLGVSILF
jgi:hypothetical protein